jgi:hypothetical protein
MVKDLKERKIYPEFKRKVNKSLSCSSKIIDDANLLTGYINLNIITYLFFYITNFTTSNI